MLRLMCESSAVWVLVEESVCRIPGEGTRTQDGVITLCVAFLCWPAQHHQGFQVHSPSWKGKNHFLHSFYHLVSLHRKILQRTGVFFKMLFSYFKTSRCFSEPQVS